MRLRLKLKFIDDLHNHSHCNNDFYSGNNYIEDSHEDNNNFDSVHNNIQTFNSFESLFEDFYKTTFEQNDMKNRLKKLQKQLRIYDEKSKKIIFPIKDNKHTKFVSQLKDILNNFLSLNYYNMGFLKEFEDSVKGFSYEIQVVGLRIDQYSLCGDFQIKDILKDDDKLE